MRRALAAMFGIMLVSSASLASTVGGNFTLTDHNNQSFELDSVQGNVVLLFFGYTFCPDICPTELSNIAYLLKNLGKRKEDVTSLFVTVDPKRDTSDKLKNYVSFFSKDLIGLTGSEVEIEKVKKMYNVKSSIYRTNKSDERYVVDHSANLYVINQQGEIANIIPYGFPIDHVEGVINQLLNQPQ